MNETQVITNIIEFLGRADLKGIETPAFNECIDYMTKLRVQKEKENTKAVKKEIIEKDKTNEI